MYEAGDWRLEGQLEWDVLAVYVHPARCYCYCTTQDETVKEKEEKKKRSHDVRGREERETARE